MRRLHMKENYTTDFIKETINTNLLNRNKKLLNTINLVLKQQDNLIISVNGEWGCGKTVFAKQIEYLINNPDEYENACHHNKIDHENKISEQMVYYYNAWENDTLNMPVQSLIFQLIKHFDIKYENSPILKNVGKSLFRLLNINCLDNLQQYTEINFNQIIDDIVDIENLKTCLNNVINQILSERKNRLLIIIDELDRCRPTYAIEMLECIKHFYYNDKLTFIVVTNNDQLSKSVKKVYGAEYNGDLYLQRFYDAIVNLNYNEITRNKYASMILGRNLEETHIYNHIITSCISYFNLELRQINTFASYIKTLDAMLGSERDFSSDQFLQSIAYYLCCIAYALNTTNTREYNDFISGNWSNIDNYVKDDPALVEWFEEFDYLRKNFKDEKFGANLLKDCYLCIFKGKKSITNNNFMMKIYNTRKLKSTIDSVLDLSF